jgi:N-acetyl-beta-hexosaminidase
MDDRYDIEDSVWNLLERGWTKQAVRDWLEVVFREFDAAQQKIRGGKNLRPNDHRRIP